MRTKRPYNFTYKAQSLDKVRNKHENYKFINTKGINGEEKKKKEANPA